MRMIPERTTKKIYSVKIREIGVEIIKKEKIAEY